EVIKYLEDENAYTKAVMAHTEALQERLYEELKGRVLQNDQSVPFREGNYFYYTRLVEGKNYPIYARKRGSLSAPEEIMIDANALAEGTPTFLIRAWDVSSAEDLLAFAVDTTGGRVSSIRFKNLRTGEMLPDVVPRAIGGIAWAEDNRTLFHAKNFRLMRTPVAKPGRDNWQEVIPHRADVLLEDFEFFRDYLVLTERKDGLVQLRVRPWSGTNEYYLDFGEPAYFTYVSTNREFDTPVLRYGYTSLTTPSSTYDYDMRTRQKTLLKRDQILGGFDPANYVTERLYTTARDGARVPVSLVHRKGIVRPAPLLLTGYGSYR